MVGCGREERGLSIGIAAEGASYHDTVSTVLRAFADANGRRLALQSAACIERGDAGGALWVVGQTELACILRTRPDVLYEELWRTRLVIVGSRVAHYGEQNYLVERGRQWPTLDSRPYEGSAIALIEEIDADWLVLPVGDPSGAAVSLGIGAGVGTREGASEAEALASANTRARAYVVVSEASYVRDAAKLSNLELVLAEAPELSRLWYAVAFSEEMRGDLKQLVQWFAGPEGVRALERNGLNGVQVLFRSGVHPLGVRKGRLDRPLGQR
jgi:hypothetical protein